MKTSKITTSARNLNVNDLLGSLLLQRGKRRDSLHSHQLFRILGKAPINKKLWDSVLRDLGHFDNLLGVRSVELLHEFHKFVPHLRHRHMKDLQVGRDIDDVVHGVPPAGRARAGEEGASVPVARRTCPRAPPPRPWPSSVPLGWCGGYSRPGPWRRSSVHTARMHGGAALFAALRHQRSPSSKEGHKQTGPYLRRDLVWL